MAVHRCTNLIHSSLQENFEKSTFSLLASDDYFLFRCFSSFTSVTITIGSMTRARANVATVSTRSTKLIRVEGPFDSSFRTLLTPDKLGRQTKNTRTKFSHLIWFFCCVKKSCCIIILLQARSRREPARERYDEWSANRYTIKIMLE